MARMDPHHVTTPGGQTGAAQVLRLFEEHCFGSDMISVPQDPTSSQFKCIAPYIQPICETGEGLIQALLWWLGYAGYGKSPDGGSSGAYMKPFEMRPRRNYTDEAFLRVRLMRHWKGIPLAGMGIAAANEMVFVEEASGRFGGIGFLPHANIAAIPNNA